MVPGSGLVKEQAEKEGLDRIFIGGGFEWREPGCSMCLAMTRTGWRAANTAPRPPTATSRAVSAGGRTRPVSPAMAAAAAVNGRFIDVRELLA